MDKQEKSKLSKKQSKTKLMTGRRPLKIQPM
jgi:hypothetical protein